MATTNWEKFKDVVKDTVDVGAKTTKMVLKEVSRKTKELTETGKIQIEITQLEKKREKHIFSLGETVLKKFKKDSQQSVTQAQVEIKEILLDIKAIERNISIKRIALEQLGAAANSAPEPDANEKPPASEASKAPNTSKNQTPPKRTTKKSDA